MPETTIGILTNRPSKVGMNVIAYLDGTDPRSASDRADAIRHLHDTASCNTGFEAVAKFALQYPLSIEDQYHSLRGLGRRPWTGTRTFLIHESQGTTYNSKIQLIRKTKSYKPPTASRLSNYVARYTKPFRNNCIYFQGHGGGYDYIARMTVPTVAHGLKMAERRTAVKPDFLIFDSCLMSNYESFRYLKERGQFAIASQGTIYTFTSLCNLDVWEAALRTNHGETEEMGREMIKAVERLEIAGDWKGHSVSLINLNKIITLEQSLQQLASLAQPFNLYTVGLNTFRECLKRSMMPSLGIADLGLFLSNYEKSELPIELRHCAMGAHSAFREAVVVSTARRYDKAATGINFMPMHADRLHSCQQNKHVTLKYNVTDAWTRLMRDIIFRARFF